MRYILTEWLEENYEVRSLVIHDATGHNLGQRYWSVHSPALSPSIRVNSRRWAVSGRRVNYRGTCRYFGLQGRQSETTHANAFFFFCFLFRFLSLFVCNPLASHILGPICAQALETHSSVIVDSSTLWIAATDAIPLASHVPSIMQLAAATTIVRRRKRRLPSHILHHLGLPSRQLASATPGMLSINNSPLGLRQSHQFLTSVYTFKMFNICAHQS